jgi:hypothetical protein
MTGVTAIMAGGRGFVPLAVAASHVSRNGRGPAPEGTVTTIALPNTTITGGVAPYTQEWTSIGGDTATISSDTALNPTWSATVASPDINQSFWQCTVTDAVSATASTDITVTLSWVQT